LFLHWLYTALGKGHAAFFVCIIVIGAMTAIIGDVASNFGCSAGVKDTVTAIVFVALGTSVPGSA
jgi:solute carrier family 8 (sodium/calcium exchanger)